MKRIKWLVGLLVAVLILVAVSAPPASAQALDGVWLKVKVTTKGYSVDPATGAYKTLNFSLTAYMQFISTGGPAYNIYLWTQVNGEWVNWCITDENAVSPGENFISDFWLEFWTSETDYFDVYHTPFITYKGSKVTYKGTGEVYYGEVEGGTRHYYGYFNISGTSVDPSKLPFTP